MKAHIRETQATTAPQKALQYLKEGNQRFKNNLRANRDLLSQVSETIDEQFPFAAILSCIDSRVSPELVFDQGLGDIFSIRIAGNFINKDILGSMEFACKLGGVRLIVVLGHTSCGAVKGACDNVELGNLTYMLDKIKPAVQTVITPEDMGLRTSKNLKFVNMVAEKNVYLTIDRIISESPILAEMQEKEEILIAGAMYDIHTGVVSFYD